MITVAERIIALRDEHELTRAEMAKRLGINKSSITRYENGEINPNLDMLIKISEQFGVSLDWLAGQDDENESEETKIRKYIPIIKECIENDISPESLLKAVELLKTL